MKGTFENGTGLITASHLVRWTELNKREAEQVFPELVRRLLDATPEASEIHMRAGDSVALSGYDGSAFLTKGSKLLPPGKLVFELGTNKDIKRKADDDFESRRSKATADETFIFATPRKWQGKDDWAAQRRVENVFKDVRVLDADDFEHWLQLVPLVQIWLSDYLEINLQEVETLPIWWARFSGSTEPVLPKALYIAGREGEARQLRDFVEDQAGQLVIESTSSDDIFGFLAAVLDQDETYDPLVSVIVESAALWKHICSLSGRGILIPVFENPDVRLAVGSGKHVIMAKDYSKSQIRTPGIFLPRVNRSAAEEALTSAGFCPEEASKLAVLARRSLPALKRRVSLVPGERSSVWMDPSSASVLSGLFVAGQWRDYPGDWKVLERLTRLSIDELAEQLSNFKDGMDPVLWNTGDIWSFVSVEEAFVELSPRFNPHLQETWISIAIEVLSEPDPLEGLDQIQRVISRKPGRKYSGDLRRGIAESIAIAASAKDGSADVSGRWTVSDKVVSETLRRVMDANDELSWLGITDILPLIAEASPEAFLSALEEDLARDVPTVAGLFEEFHDPLGFGPTVHYSALLWALELLCWNPEYITRSIRILTRLAVFPVPANRANTPLASMGAVLCGWLPRNQLDNAMRRELLDACFRLSPETARALLMELWPSRNSMLVSPYRPRYRGWLASSEAVTYGQLFEFIDILADRAVTWATEDPLYLNWMIEAIETSTSIAASGRLLDYLESRVREDALGRSSQLDLLAAVSEAVVKHERYSDANWAMPVEIRDRLNDLRALLDPSGLYSQAFFIFEWNPKLENVDCYGSEYYEELGQKRISVVERILGAPRGWEVLQEIAKRVDDSGSVGRSIPVEEGLKTLDRLTYWLESNDEKLTWAAKVWVQSWLQSNGPMAVSEALNRKTLSGEARRQFVHCIPKSGRYWKVLVTWPDEYSEYWEKGRFDILDVEDLDEAVQELLRYGRGSTAAVTVFYALDHLSLRNRHSIDVDIVISSLRSAISAREDLQRVEPYQVGEMLTYLEDRSVGQDTLASLEYAFLPWLEDFHEPKALNRFLATNPHLFVELVCRAYRGENEGVLEPRQESSPNQAEGAWSVLKNWKGFPGRNDDGSVDSQTLGRWVGEARKQLRESGRADIGDQLIGETFVNAPQGSDGIWPAEPIRDLIEELSSPHIENGIFIGQLNSRGATSRGIYEGGSQERDLAKQYFGEAKTIEFRWPRSAEVLKNLARQYERDAAREDLDADVAQDFN